MLISKSTLISEREEPNGSDKPNSLESQNDSDYQLRVKLVNKEMESFFSVASGDVEQNLLPNTEPLTTEMNDSLETRIFIPYMQDEADGLIWDQRRAVSCYSLAELCKEDWGGKAKIFLIKLPNKENADGSGTSRSNLSQEST